MCVGRKGRRPARRKKPDYPAGSLTSMDEEAKQDPNERPSVRGSEPFRGRRTTELRLKAITVAFAYVSHVSSTGRGLLSDTTSFERDGESEAERQSRILAARVQTDLMTRTVSLRQVCAEELRDVKPDEANQVVIEIFTYANGWASSPDSPPISPEWLRDGIDKVLDAMCPRDQRASATKVLDRMLPAGQDEPHASVGELPAYTWIAKMHCAAAWVAALYRSPAVVPDHVATQVQFVRDMSTATMYRMGL